MFFDFEKVIFFPEEASIVLYSFADFRFLFSSDDHLSDLTIEWSWESDDIGVISFEEFEIDSRTTIVVSLNLWESHEFDKISISYNIFREENNFEELIILILIPFFERVNSTPIIGLTPTSWQAR